MNLEQSKKLFTSDWFNKTLEDAKSDQEFYQVCENNGYTFASSPAQVEGRNFLCTVLIRDESNEESNVIRVIIYENGEQVIEYGCWKNPTYVSVKRREYVDIWDDTFSEWFLDGK